MRSMILATSVAAVIGFSLSPAARADDPPDLFDEHLADFLWIGTGDGTTWQNAANWDPPNGFGVEYPDDPDRIDTAEQTLVDVEGANFSIALSNDLTVNINGGDVTVAAVKMGGTGAAVTTDIVSSTSHILVFENQESNDFVTNPGDETADPEIEPEPIWSYNQARALIWSTGTTALGEVNRITARVRPNDDVDVEGDRDLHIYGDILEGDRLAADGIAVRDNTSISSLLSGGARLHVHGNIRVEEFDNDPVAGGTQERVFGLNVIHGVVTPLDPQDPPDEEDEVSRLGIIDIHGRFLGAGWVQIGPPQDNTLPVGSVILRTDNRDDPENPTDEFYSGRTIINRGNLVLGSDGVFGEADIVTGNPNQGFGFNFISTDDARNISNETQITQWHTIAGATDAPGLESFGDHSIEFSGEITQSNTRGWINLLPAGKHLKISGPQYALEAQADSASPDRDRIYTIDGSGLTLVTGGIHNRNPDGTEYANGSFRKRGSGTVIIDFDETLVGDTATDYKGYTFVQGGNLHFATADDLPNPSSHATHAFTPEMVATSGAVGLDAGVSTNAAFLGMFNNSSNPNFGFDNPLFRVIANETIFALYDSGGLMLASGEYGNNLNLGSGDLAKVANMTLAAHEGGSTYRGTITPHSTIAVNPNTYQLGGGAGTLTLPGTGPLGGPYAANQLTGSRHVLVTNGGEVRIEGTNNYTGTTRVVHKFGTSLREEAADSLPGIEDEASESFIDGDLFRRSTLTVTNLTGGSSPSSIGSSSPAAGNLLIQNSTLKYVGPAVSTNRLFTVGTGGATIDASGTGALNFNSTGTLGMDVAEDRDGIVGHNAPGSANNEVFGRPDFGIPFNTEDLLPGMPIRDVHASPILQDDLVIGQISGDHVVHVAEDELDEEEAAWTGASNEAEIRTFRFGGVARTMTLSGNNMDNNTLAPLITNAAAATGTNTVNLAKDGPGKWILTANNTYGGTTTVNAGTLLVNGGHTGTGLTTVNDGGTLGGTGSLAGGVTVNDGGHLAPGASIGTFTVGGALTLEAGSILDFELGAPSNGDLINATLADGLTINGGTFNFINFGGLLDDGTYTLIDYAGTAGGSGLAAFLNQTPTGPEGFTFDIVDNVGASAIQVIVSAGTEGDINGDGFVNMLDYVVGRKADPAGTGTDLIAWRENYDGSGGGASSAVPEPGTLLLVGLALIGAQCQRRRRR